MITMELIYQLLLYFDKRRHLIDMKNDCIYFLKQLNEKTISKFPPFRFLLNIDVMDLLNEFPDLGELLIKEPLKLQNICNEILFGCLQAVDNDYTKVIQRSQIAVNMRFKCVPKILFVPNPLFYGGLTVQEGLLLSISQSMSYAYQTVWSCPEECEGNEVILQHIPKFPPKCYICKSVLFENSGLRRCGDEVKATFRLKGQLLSKSFTIVDDLIPKLKLGASYSLHVIVLKKLTAVWSLEESLTLATPMTCSISRDIEKLYHDCGGIPWKFVYCLASGIAINVCPANCFMHLKVSLLLSLASIKANILTGSNVVHVLVGTLETRFIGDIMAEASKLAERSVSFGTTNTSVATSLIASSGGVCILPLPLHIYNQKQISSILSALETEEIVTDTSKTKLQSAVWAQGMDVKKVILHNVASVFGTICKGDYGEFNDDIVQFMLQEAIDPVEPGADERKALKEVSEYINIVAGIEVALDKVTEEVLRNYFLAARKESARCVSVGNMRALVATCLTSARLCRRKVTSVDDAVLAIWLHLSGNPEPRVAPDEYFESPRDVCKLQTMMNNFKNWLEQFTGCYIYS